jgi:hypothetical protein
VNGVAGVRRFELRLALGVDDVVGGRDQAVEIGPERVEPVTETGKGEEVGGHGFPRG